MADVTAAIFYLKKNGSTVTATVLTRFSRNSACEFSQHFLDKGLQISVLRHKLPIKMTVGKIIKTEGEMNLKKMPFLTNLDLLNMNVCEFSAFSQNTLKM